MNTYELIALGLLIFGCIAGAIAFRLSVDGYVKEYAHDTTKGLGGPPNQKVRDKNSW